MKNSGFKNKITIKEIYERVVTLEERAGVAFDLAKTRTSHFGVLLFLILFSIILDVFLHLYLHNLGGAI